MFVMTADMRGHCRSFHHVDSNAGLKGGAERIAQRTLARYGYSR
jgi:hypothetical protein